MTGMPPAAPARRIIPLRPAPHAPRGRLARLGDFLARRRGLILALQWLVVLAYLFLVAVPAFLPLPDDTAHLWNNLTRFAQFAFWGLWWPGVMIATASLGRVWCGLFCPEGALSEWTSRYGLGRPVPGWMKWGGWPLLAFLGTTVYGQLVSVYEYPQPALLVLGGSTVAAVAVALVYGKGKRVWCRHLCPANGVFALLAKIAPLHYRVDRQAWDAAPSGRPVDCAPLVDIRRMKSASDCHACGRCSGHRNAVRLSWRAPWREILDQAAPPRWGEILTLLFGVLGVATAAFQWSASPWLVQAKLRTAAWLLDHGHEALLGDDAPWWLLTHMPALGDVFTWLDGLLILTYLLGGGALLGGALAATVGLAAHVAGSQGPGFRRLVLALVPLATASVILGLSMLTISHLRAEHVSLSWLPAFRGALFALGSGGSLIMAWAMLKNCTRLRRGTTTMLFSTGPLLLGTLWYQVFFVW